MAEHRKPAGGFFGDFEESAAEIPQIPCLDKNSDVGTTPTEEAKLPEPKRIPVRIKNRRRMYLEANPSYLDNPDHELADPLLYDRTIRHFQTSAEREAAGKAKGYSGQLEADLLRSEAKLAALAGRPVPGTLSSPAIHPEVTYVAGPDGQVLPDDEDEVPTSKEEGAERWREAMTRRFVEGRDEEFEYARVDADEGLDVLERREEEERWFDEEDPGWVDDGVGGRSAEERGETGVQDF